MEQMALNIDEATTVHERIYHPVIGVVAAVRYCDDPANRSRAVHRSGVGTHAEAKVLVINDGMDTSWWAENVAIIAGQPTGVDDYAEDLPRPCSQTLDGSAFPADLASVDPAKLDGDRCVVMFVGGRIDQGFIAGWWPHQYNRRDPATSGRTGGTLDQRRRFFRRKNGVQVVITPRGDVLVDTNGANAELVGSTEGPRHMPRAGFGNVGLDMKAGSRVAYDWNPPVYDPVNQPAVPQPNPPLQRTAPPRKKDKTRFECSEDEVAAIAGKRARLMSRGGLTEVGGTPETPPIEPAVLGSELLKAVIQFVNEVNARFVALGQPIVTFPTGSPDGSGITWLSKEVKIK
jgi:hypothetical protein